MCEVTPYIMVSVVTKYGISLIQWNLSIMVTLGPDVSGLSIQVAVIEKTCIKWSTAF